MFIPPITNLLGGLSLIASGLMPGSAAAAPKPVETPTVISAPTATIENPETAQDWSRTKKLFNDMGWTLSTVGLFTGCINGVSLGFVSKQPSMVLSSIANLVTVPFLLVDPSITVRTAMWLFTGPWLAGFANKVHNDFKRKPGEEVLEFDMAPLVKLSALREKASTHGDKNLAKTWLREAKHMFQFAGNDQVRIVKDTSSAFIQGVTQPKAVLEGTRKSLREVYDFMKGRRKETPDALQPNPMQNQLGAMLLYSGSIPILLLGGDSGIVTETCTKLAAAGFLSANTALFATAIQEKENMLAVALPLSVVGNAFMHTDIGMGTSQVATAGIQDYFRKQIVKGADKAALEEANKEAGKETNQKPLSQKEKSRISQ